jgi:hypothetical protein
MNRAPATNSDPGMSSESDARAAGTLVWVLERVTNLAADLNQLNTHGLGYPQKSDAMAPRAGVSHDVESLGVVLEDMLAGVTAPTALAGLHEEAIELAAQCIEEAPEIRRVLITLRLLLMRARHAESDPDLDEYEAILTEPARPPSTARPQGRPGALIKWVARQAAELLLG